MASTLGATLYGMKNMSSNEAEVRELISVIIQKIKGLYLLTHSLTHSLTYSLTYLLTHSRVGYDGI